MVIAAAVVAVDEAENAGKRSLFQTQQARWSETVATQRALLLDYGDSSREAPLANR